MIRHLEQVLAEFSRHGFNGFVEEWQSIHAHRGKPVSIKRGEELLRGIASGVDGSGALRLVDDRGEVVRVTTGEVMA